MTETTSNPLGKVFGQFSRNFWVVNTMELFERGAYYGMMSVLGVHVVKNLLISEAVWGSIYGFMIALLYLIPLVSGALAEKYGYRSILIVCFLLMITGYISLGFADGLPLLLVGIIVMGVGAGAFKPMISASIAHITADEKRNLAYSIYYWMINLGAFTFPLVIGLFITDFALYRFIFFISVTFAVVNLMIVLFGYENPVEPKPEVSVKNAIAKIGPAFKDKKFMILVGIYSGFWFMFAFNHTFLPLFMVDFGKMPVWFSVPLLATFNPGTIITLGPFLGKLVEKYDSLKIMIAGMLIFIAGLLVVAFSFHPILFVAGIVIFSIGEFIVHPNFISYVSKIAPKDKVAIYMACIFIATGAGNIAGGPVQGLWYTAYAKNAEMPKLFIALIALVGAVTILGFLLYNSWIFKMHVAKGKKKAEEGGLLTKPITTLVPIGIAIAVVAAGFVGAKEPYLGVGEDEDTKALGTVSWTTSAVTLTETTGANDETNTFELAVENLTKVTVTLTWTDDELISNPRNTDILELSLSGENAANFTFEPDATVSGDDGQLTITASRTQTLPEGEMPYANFTRHGWDDGAGNWTVAITVTPYPIRDNGNDWSLTVSYEYATGTFNPNK